MKEVSETSMTSARDSRKYQSKLNQSTLEIQRLNAELNTTRSKVQQNSHRFDELEFENLSLKQQIASLTRELEDKDRRLSEGGRSKEDIAEISGNVDFNWNSELLRSFE
jgi:peptidoglycan hydrolase CwlO-like protein